MKRILTGASRAAALVYIVVLWAGVLPTNLWPLDGWQPARDARLGARRLLSKLTLSPGDAIFTGSPGELKVAANCLTVSGSTRSGATIVLYENACPRKGFRARNPVFDQVLQEMTRVPVVPPLQPGTSQAQRLRDIADYFCHAPRVEEGSLRSVSLQQVVHLRSVRTGERLVNAALLCRRSCRNDAPSLPTCEYRGEPRRAG